MTPKHTNSTPTCASCEKKLLQAHPLLAEWFRDKIKPNYPDCHISWSYRGQADQEKAFIERKSALRFPLSMHNKSDDQGNPCSLALDLFELDYHGMACWHWKYFRDIATFCEKENMPIFWGGHWKKLGDFDHFQLVIKNDTKNYMETCVIN